MKTNSKKAQIIKCYIDELLPYLNYNNFDNDLKLCGTLKFGEIESLQNSNLDKFIKYDIDDEKLYLDFEDSSISNIYKGLNIINKTILSA